MTAALAGVLMPSQSIPVEKRSKTCLLIFADRPCFAVLAVRMEDLRCGAVSEHGVSVDAAAPVKCEARGNSAQVICAGIVACGIPSGRPLGGRGWPGGQQQNVLPNLQTGEAAGGPDQDPILAKGALGLDQARA